jgi:hypothetical protein
MAETSTGARFQLQCRCSNAIFLLESGTSFLGYSASLRFEAAETETKGKQTQQSPL